MKCRYCGKNNKPGAVVCRRCGVALPAESAGSGFSNNSKDMIEVGEVIDSSGVSSNNNRKFGGKAASASKIKLTKKSALVGLCVLLGIILVAALVIVIAVNAGNIILPSRNSYSVHSDAVIYRGEFIEPDNSGIAFAEANLDGTRAAILTKDGTLYSCGRGSVTAAANSVKDFDVSVNGKKIVYTDTNSLLWSYDCVKTSSTPVCISNEAVMDSFVISPDGGTVLFVRQSDGMLCASVNGNVRELENGLTPISTSDGGRNIYCYSPAENSVYFFNKRNKKSFVRSRVEGEIWLNSRHDEIVLAADSGEGIVLTLIIKDGGDPVSLLNSTASVSPVFPVSGLTITDKDEHFTVRTCPFKSFSGKLFSGAALVSYDRKTGAETVDADPVSLAYASDNYFTVYYLNEDGRLFSRSAINKGEAESLASDCSDFTISANGKTLWYTDKANKLWYISGRTVRAVANNVESFAVVPAGSNAILLSGGALYINRSGRANQSYFYEVPIVSDIFCDARGLYYRLENGSWNRIGNGGKRVDLTK